MKVEDCSEKQWIFVIVVSYWSEAEWTIVKVKTFVCEKLD